MPTMYMILPDEKSRYGPHCFHEMKDALRFATMLTTPQPREQGAPTAAAQRVQIFRCELVETLTAAEVK